MKASKTKSYVLAAIIYAAVFAIYNILIFLIFNNYNNIFWISYGFMTAALIANIVIILIASKKTDVEAAFFGIPLLSFSVFHVIAEFFASLVFMIFRASASVKLTISIQAILFLILVVFGALAILSRDAVQAIGDNVRTNVANIKGLAVDVQLLEQDCIDAELKGELHKVHEAIRYSDPMTNDTVAQLDEMIRGKVSELKFFCQNSNKAEALEACYKLQAYVRERNAKLLISK